MQHKSTAPEALRQFLRTGQEDAPRVLPGLLARAVETFGQPGAVGQAAAQAGQCAHLLATLLRTQRDPALAGRLIQALASAGRLGRALAALSIQSRALPLAQCTPLLLALPGRDFLALVNDMLLDCPADDKQLAAWLKTLLPAPGRLDPREALLFLRALAQEAAPLARALRDALLAAGLGDTMARALAGAPGATTAEALLLAADMLAVPAVQSEVLAYALRTAGSEGPSRLGPLLAAPADLAPRDAALAVELRRLALLPEAAERLFPAAQAEPEMLGLVLADLLGGGGSFAGAALSLLPLLPRQGVQACRAALPESARPAILAPLMQALAALEPDFLRRAAKVLDTAQALDSAAAQALAGLLAARPAPGPGSPLAVTAWEPAPEPPLGPAATPPKPAQGRRTPLAEAVKDALAPVKDQDCSHSTLADTELEGLTVSGSDLSRCRFAGVTFRRVRLSAAQLFQCLFENCVFQSCAFVGVDFFASRFSACRFESCTFDFCDLSYAKFAGSTLSGCALAESSLAGALLSKTRLAATSLRTCTLAGARVHECALMRLSFTRTDLSASLWEKTICRETEFLACSFAAARLLSCECLSLRLVRCALGGLTVLGGHTDNPHLAQAERRARLYGPGAARHAAEPLPAALQNGAGAAFVSACVDAFLRVDEARRSLTAMRGQDQRRRELACERLTEAQAQFLALLPTLLATDVFDRALGLGEVPACALAGHARPESLSRETRAQLERLFPGQAASSPARAPQILVEAVYAMGSLGSVAQRPNSDMDCWLCLSPVEGAGPGARAGLARKLAALEAWAGREFGLETHFFAMTLDEVRANRFGISDKESSGSAQAALLKEEFCRTALKLAGKDLLWWATPPTATQAEAEALLAELARLAPRTAAELVDLGQPRPIPAGEYFGACLWQVVKALHSPYKSVLKLGLLEKYAGQGRDTRLLCDQIKEAVLRGRRTAQDVDPYLRLFTGIRKHYRSLADETSLGLIGECLRLKAQVPPEDLPEEFEGGGPATQATDAGAFAGAMRLGGLVTLFMVSAYRRIQEGLRANKATARISPEDLTRLGRRVAANFSQHRHKVGVVPFLSDDTGFSELFFYAEKAPGKRPIWAVKGKDKAAGKVAVESLAPIRRDTDVVRLLAWLLFNGLYDPRQTVQAEKSLAPIAVLDLQNLLAELAEFFPRQATLEPDLDEYLKGERVVRAHLIANLPVSVDKNRIHTVSVLYATNWGEVFCQSFENPPLILQKSALAFLREVLDKPLPQDVTLKVFTPKKSACPRIPLA